jgi:hypothetical protein
MKKGMRWLARDKCKCIKLAALPAGIVHDSELNSSKLTTAHRFLYSSDVCTGGKAVRLCYRHVLVRRTARMRWRLQSCKFLTLARGGSHWRGSTAGGRFAPGSCDGIAHGDLAGLRVHNLNRTADSLPMADVAAGPPAGLVMLVDPKQDVNLQLDPPLLVSCGQLGDQLASGAAIE